MALTRGFIHRVKEASEPEAALAIVRARVESEFEALSAPEEREALCRAIFKHIAHSQPPNVRVTKEDLYGALACFWLVFLSCLPAAVPFLVLDNPRWALRVSNGLLVVMLFLVGHRWAKYANAHRLGAGTAMVAIGLALVGVAVLLGG